MKTEERLEEIENTRGSFTLKTQQDLDFLIDTLKKYIIENEELKKVIEGLNEG